MMPRNGPLNTWLFVITLIAIAAAGFYFRLWQWQIQLLADDEWHALNKLLKSDAGGIFTSFGTADHSIPVTLYYYLVSQFSALTENIMRWPMLIAGLSTPVAAIWLVRRILTHQEKAILFALLALSPILIYFARTARPYAISTLLAFGAVIFFYCWAIRPNVRHAIGYVVMCTLCAWLQPVTIVLVLSPFLFFGCKSLYYWVKKGDNSLFLKLLALGLIQFAALCMLLGPPVYFSLEDIAGKAGVDSPTIHSVFETFKLLVGSEYGLYAGAFLLVTVWGGYSLSKRQREFTLYLVACSLLSLGAILTSGAIWIQHSLVMARYSLPVFLIMGVFAAVGLGRIMQVSSRSKLPQTIGLVLLSVGIYAAGPLAKIYSGPINQFTGHMGYQFDYDWDANTYNKVLDYRPIPPFYMQLGTEPEQSLRLVIAPWFMEWHWNRWYLEQPIHRQIVTAGFLTGFCGSSFNGEYSPNNPRVNLHNVVHLSALAEGTREFDYLIYNKGQSRGERDIDRYTSCEEQIRNTFGEPDYEDEQLVAYQLK